MEKLIVALVDFVVRKAADIVKHQFGAIDQSQATSGGVYKELVAEATINTGDKLCHFLYYLCSSLKV